METNITKNADELENKIAKLGFGLTYDEIVKVAIVIAEEVKETHPMYIGVLNPKWALWNDTIVELNNRVSNFCCG